MWGKLLGAVNPYLTYIKIAAVVLILTGTFWAGHHLATLQEDAAIAKAEAHAIQVTQARDQITHDADLAAAQAQVKIQTVTQTLIKEVPKYVTAKANRACIITRGFVRVFNAGARGVQPVPLAAGIADEPAPVSLADVAGTAGAGGGTYQAVAQQLRDLQGWVTAQQALKR